ncbi:MAG: TatD family hydrolase [Candidatus Dadabacteria bacterium]
MQFIDSHAHIYLPEFDNDRSAVIDKALGEGVETILLPAIDSSTHTNMLETAQKYPCCKSMMGLHPCSVNQDYKKELDNVQQYLESQEFIAVGEIGLDFYWDKTYTEEQYAAFRQQVTLSLKYKLPIAIHSRNSIDECISVVSEFPGARGVFHCFSGNLQQAWQIMELGFMMGIGGVATFKNGGLDKVIPEIGLSNIILETDAPYLAPVPYRGKRNESSYIPLIAERLSTLLKVSIDEVAEITSANCKKLFALS